MAPVYNTLNGREVVKTILAFCGVHPHDYQLDGILVALDGESLLATMATGSGKTGFFSFLMLVIIAISKSPDLALEGRTYPKNPAMVIVIPTMALQYNMVCLSITATTSSAIYTPQQENLQKIGLDTVVINSETTRQVKTSQARKATPSLWTECQKKHTIILMSPEMLVSPGCRTLLDNQAFKDRCVCLGVDEVHLIVNWGGFRDTYNQIGHMRARFPTTLDGSYIPVIATSATIREGHPKQRICEVLGLEPGKYHLLRRSNLRPDIQIIVRELSSETSMSGYSFPDLDWILKSGRTTVVFCKTINLGFRVASYFWRRAPAMGMKDLQSKIRLFNSLNAPAQNQETLGFINNNEDATIIIATDVLSVGWDSPSVADCVVLGVPQDLDEVVQKWGRVGRDPTKVKDPRAYLYCPKGTFALAQQVVNANTGGAKGKVVQTQMGLSIAQFIAADCKTEDLNIQYNNPTVDPACSCPRCATKPSHPGVPQVCGCNGPQCKPEPDTPPDPKPKGPGKARARPGEGVSKAMSQLAYLRFLDVRREIFNTEQENNPMLPPYIYLPDPVIAALTKAVYSINVAEDTVPYLSKANPLLIGYKDRIFACCQDLLPMFAEIRAQEKSLRAAKKAGKKGVDATEEVAEMEVDSDPEDLEPGTEETFVVVEGNGDEENGGDGDGELVVQDLYKTGIKWKINLQQKSILQM